MESTASLPTAPPAPIPLQIVTGFLGAGKTTLLNRLLKDDALAGTVVIVNEFGEVGLDHLLIEQASDGLVLLESGCLCCTIRGDLVNTLEDLLRRFDNGRLPALKRVVIETTGLADPVPVIASVIQHPYLDRRYAIDGVITVVDAVNGLATLDTLEEAVRQVAVADRIVLTKTDLPEARPELATLRATLASIAPGAPVLAAGPDTPKARDLIGLGLFDVAAKPEAVGAWLAIEELAGAHDHAHDISRHGPDVRAVTLSADQPIRAQSFDLFWTMLRSTHGPKLLRLKGIVHIAEHPERPLVVHAVQRLMHPPEALARWPGADRRSHLVLIARDLDMSVVERLWSAFLGHAATT